MSLSLEKAHLNQSPVHVAIIMDGNGRWGLKKFKSRKFGHKKGIEVDRKVGGVPESHMKEFLDKNI